MVKPQRQLDVMLLSAEPLWPLMHGEGIRGCHLAQSMRNLGVRVGVASMQGHELRLPQTLDEMVIPFHEGRDVQDLIGEHQPAAVVGLDVQSLPLLAALSERTETKLVWYPADDPVRRLLSQRTSLPRLAQAAKRLVQQRHMVQRIDGVIAASEFDAGLLRRLSLARHATMVKAGVDAQYFTPPGGPLYRHHKHLVFWGRLDAEHNVQAIRWFCGRVWPVLHRLCPSARLNIVGRNPTQAIMELAERRGVTVTGEVADIRPHAWDAAITIVPQRSGPAVCNALLEAAAMGRPTVASRYAVRNVSFCGPDAPMLVCGSEHEWVESICRLWADPAAMHKASRSARAWVLGQHQWDACTINLLAWLEAIPGEAVSSILDRHERRRLVVGRVAGPQGRREAA